MSHSEGHFQGRKGHVGLIFTYFSITISVIEVLRKCIASCSLSGVILVVMVLIHLKGYFQGQKSPIWTFVIHLGQYLKNNAYCKQPLYVTPVQNHIVMIFHFTL